MQTTLRGLLSAALVLTLSGSVFADHEKISPEKLPQPVIDTLKSQFPKGQWKSAERWTHDGKTCYEVDFTADGNRYKAEFSDNKLVDYCKEIKVKELPKSVSDAIEAKYPKSSIKEAAEHFEGKASGYKLDVKTDDGKHWCVKTDLQGKVLDAKDKEEIKKEKEGK